jgi:DNA polymerase III subunit delta
VSTPIHALDFLEKPRQPASVNVLFGSEWFLKQLVFEQIRRQLLGKEDSIPFESFDGDEIEWRDVADELATASLFAPEGPRLALIRNADSFLSKNRASLERYVAHPSPHGVLVLLIDTFPGNTRLYKLVNSDHLAVDCRPPEKTVGRNRVVDQTRLLRWISEHAKQAHQLVVPRPSAELLFQIVGADMGRLDQEIAKLAAYVGENGKATVDVVTELVGGWRKKTAWEMIDSMLEGDAAAAIEQLDRLISAGEHPVGLLAQISWSLRQMAAATRFVQEAERRGQRVGLAEALRAAGVGQWQSARENAERRLRRIGRARGSQLYNWLLEADLALKGSHSSPERARWMLEQLVLRLAKQRS